MPNGGKWSWECAGCTHGSHVALNSPTPATLYGSLRANLLDETVARYGVRLYTALSVAPLDITHVPQLVPTALKIPGTQLDIDPHLHAGKQ